MRSLKTRNLLPVALCAAALLSFACGGGVDRSEQVPPETSPATQEAQAPPVNELRPDPQSVQIQDETPPVVDPDRDESADLSARERELAARESELRARERRLREQQDQARSTSRRPAPRPASEEPARPAQDPVQDDEEAAPAPEPAREEPLPEPAEPPVEQPRTVNVTLPAGTTLDVEFTDSVSSNTSAPGDTFRVRVTSDLREDGVVAIPRGSEIVGVVTDAVPLKRVGGQARLGLKFTDLVLPSGSTVPVHASFVQQGRSETGRDAATIGGAAAGGAILGRILNKGSRSKGTVIGAIIGAVAGTAIASKTAGEEVVIMEGSVVTLRLDDSVEVRARERP
jgi:type IV secretory pathway VirB10-like protein